MEIIRLCKQGKITSLVLDKKISTGKRVLDLFKPLTVQNKDSIVIRDSKTFGGVHLGS